MSYEAVDSTGIKGRRCLVLGGGFIGTNLARGILASGAKVKTFSRSYVFHDALCGIEALCGDITDLEQLVDLCRDTDIIYHVLGNSTPASANISPAEELDTAVAPTLRLLEAVASLGKRLVFVSSGGTVYGAPTSIPITENANNWPHTAYGIGKLVVERYLALYRRLHGLDYRILRLANPYGPYQIAHRGQGAIASFTEKALKGETISIWGDGSVVRDYIYADDAVNAMLAAAMTTSEHRLFNIGSGQGLSLGEIVAELEQTLGQPLKVEYSAARAVDVPINVLDISRAEQELNWTNKVGFAEGLRQTVNWMDDLLGAN